MPLTAATPRPSRSRHGHHNRRQSGAGAGADDATVTRRPGRWIDRWAPEDPLFWNGAGRRVARTNLVWSIATEHIGFSVRPDQVSSDRVGSTSCSGEPPIGPGSDPE